MSNTVSNGSTATPGKGHNNPPEREFKYDVVAMFKSAWSDELNAARLKTTATSRAMVAILSYFDWRFGDTNYAETLWKFDNTRESYAKKQAKFDGSRYEKFREEMFQLLGFVKADGTVPVAARDDDWYTVNTEYNNRQTLWGRAMVDAVLLADSQDPERSLTAAEVLSWYDPVTAMFSVPYKKLLGKDEDPAFTLARMVNGRGNPGDADYQAPNPEFKITLDGGRWTYSAPGKGVREFRATVVRLREAVRSHRVTAASVAAIPAGQVDEEDDTDEDDQDIGDNGNGADNTETPTPKSQEASAKGDAGPTPKVLSPEAFAEEQARRGRIAGQSNDAPGGSDGAPGGGLHHMLQRLTQQAASVTSILAADPDMSEIDPGFVWKKHPDHQHIHAAIASLEVALRALQRCDAQMLMLEEAGKKRAAEIAAARKPARKSASR